MEGRGGVLRIKSVASGLCDWALLLFAMGNESAGGLNGCDDKAYQVR